MTQQDWNEELEYCLSIIRTRGDKNVGNSYVSYCKMQLNSARRAGYEEIASKIEKALAS